MTHIAFVLVSAGMNFRCTPFSGWYCTIHHQDANLIGYGTDIDIVTTLKSTSHDRRKKKVIQLSIMAQNHQTKQKFRTNLKS